MADALTAYLDEWRGSDPARWRTRALAVLTMIPLAGALPFLSYFVRASTWVIWGLMIPLLASFWVERSTRRLFGALAPFLLWTAFYFTWAAIIAEQPNYRFAVKVLIMSALLGGSMAALAADPRRLRTFASTAQFAVIGNILVMALSSVSSQVDTIVQTVTARSAAFEASDFNRYGGLWGNPNMAGYICLVVLILSVFASRRMALLGRICSLPILYLSASRKSAILFLVILVLYLAMTQARNLKTWFWGITITLVLGISFALSSTLQQTSRSAASNAYLARMMDVQERYVAERGGETRIDLLKDWLEVAAREPWYGYGLNAMTGTQYDEDVPGRVVQKGLVPNGVHNFYLGLYIDAGPVGLATFLAMLLYYLRRCLFTRSFPAARWALVSLAMINVIFLFVSHSQLSSFEGEIAYTLMFLLPFSPALRPLPREWEAPTPTLDPRFSDARRPL